MLRGLTGGRAAPRRGGGGSGGAAAAPGTRSARGPRPPAPAARPGAPPRAASGDAGAVEAVPEPPRLTAAAAAAKYGWDFPDAAAAPAGQQQQGAPVGPAQQQQDDGAPQGRGARLVQDVPIALIRRPLGRTRANGARAGWRRGHLASLRRLPRLPPAKIFLLTPTPISPKPLRL
jgi:hypothetical protein